VPTGFSFEKGVKFAKTIAAGESRDGIEKGSVALAKHGRQARPACAHARACCLRVLLQNVAECCSVSPCVYSNRGTGLQEALWGGFS